MIEYLASEKYERRNRGYRITKMDVFDVRLKQGRYCGAF